MQVGSHINLAKTVIEIEIEALTCGKERLDGSFAQSVELIMQCKTFGRVVVMGMGKSGHIGKKIAATLASTGTPAFFVHPAEAGHGDLGMITKNDVVIAISQSGKSDELLRVMPYFKRNGIKFIAMTGGLNSPLAELADLVIDTTVPQEACPLGLAPTASTTLTLALGDALAVCLLRSSGFTANNFAETHPHGTLGRKLLVTIDDIMVKKDSVPIVSLGTSIRSAIGEMSRAPLGFVNVVDDKNHLLGIFTDGDLRRTLDQDIDIRTTPIDKVMARSFVVAYRQQMAVEAVELMELHKISSIPIVDEEKLIVGAINMRMLLQAGVV